MSGSNSEATQAISSFRVLLARVLWTMVLPVVLFLAAYRIVDRGNGWFTAWDLAFWVVVALMLGCRGVEQRSGEATTLTGKASTPQHFLRYAVALFVATGLVWIIANVIGNAGPAPEG